MREIKFRLWNPSKPGYHYDQDTVIECLKQQLTGIYNHEAEYGAAFEQFTGLRDKNGREIYEGDIVYAEHPDEGYLNAQIVYDDIGSFVLKCNSLSALIPVQRVEIIGNIHENPELLA